MGFQVDVFFALIYHNWTQFPNGVPKPIPFCPIWRNDISKSIGFFFSLTIIFQSIWSLEAKYYEI
jgi:hypothetical protein